MKAVGKKLNYGRMMLEMLGVLALIGLLTLGFIFYQKALLADRVNRLMEDARLAGLVVLDGVYKKLTVNEELSLKGQFEQQTPYNFSAYLESEELKTFVVLADSVPYDVCREIIDRHPQWAEEIIANRLENKCIAEMDNIVGFFYNDELTNIKDFCTKDSDCGECGKCKNNRCSYGFLNSQSGRCFNCGASAMYSSTNGGRCISCMTSGSSHTDYRDVPYEECMKCPNQASTVYPGEVGRCYYCEGNFDKATQTCDSFNCSSRDSSPMGVAQEACDKCPNRYYAYVDSSGNGDYQNRCVKCGVKGRLNQGVTSFEECLRCPGQASDVGPGETGICRLCAGTVNPTTGKCE